MDSAPFTLFVSPSGRPHLRVARSEVPDTNHPDDRNVDLAAFDRGPAHGILSLAKLPAESRLSPAFTYFREFARLFLTAICKLPETASGPSPPENIDSIVAAAPPMVGAEYLTRDALAGLWNELGEAFAQGKSESGESLELYMARFGALWHLVGRVYFHLAENKKDERAPFAFLATYTTSVSGDDRVKHLPLGKALETYAGARNQSALLALLAPVQRAAEKSEFLKAMVDAGEVFHPLAWTPNDAYRFLKEVPSFEASGIVVRVPNWWTRKPPRPTVGITLGGKRPAGLGLTALLDFSINVALEGETLTDEEIAEMLASKDGLTLLRGKWVEIDHDRLTEVLTHWRTVQKEAGADGVSFLEGMRMLAGVRLEGAEASMDLPVADWSKVTAGGWLSEVIDGIRHDVGTADPGKDLNATLRPYQEQGVRWLHALARLRLGACLADDMGLGKTLQVIATLLLLKGEKALDRPALLVMPASLLMNWQSELSRFSPSLRPLIAHASFIPAERLANFTPKDLAGTDVVLTTYGSTHRLGWLSTVAWGVVVLDEAQAIKNPNAKQTRAVKGLKGDVRIALTGTPVENRLGDLWSIFDFLAPGLLGSPKVFSGFVKRLAEDPRGYAPLRSLIGPYILRRSKSDKSVIKDLPDKTEIKAFCSLTKTQAQLYQHAVKELSFELERLEGIKRRGVVLAFLMRFKQICNHPSLWQKDAGFAPEESGKFARLRELSEAIASRQEGLLVFTQFREMTGPLASFLETIFERPGLVLHGGTAVKKRQELVDAFQKEDGPPFFVLSLKAGGTGLNLTRASHVVHFDRWWNPAVENQATDRAYRIGQKKNVLVHKFVCKGTLEEKIDAMLEDKKNLQKAILEGGGEISLTELSNAALKKLVSLDIHAALADG